MNTTGEMNAIALDAHRELHKIVSCSFHKYWSYLFLYICSNFLSLFHYPGGVITTVFKRIATKNDQSSQPYVASKHPNHNT